LAGGKRAVNLEHFRAFLWLRWRLRINQMKRGGVANLIALAILTVAGVVASIVLFFVFLGIGLFALNDSPPVYLMYIWDGLVVAFLFFWIIGLFTELQRSEALSLNKFLHLPVSLTSAFLINYVSSLSSAVLLFCVPAMLGLWLGLLVSWGWAMLLLLPLLAAFLLMVTALTYQFQGWLASLMTNPRRRRTVIAVVTLIFILVFQVPNLINILVQRRIHENRLEQMTRPNQPPPLVPKIEEVPRKDFQKQQDRLEAIQRENEARKKEKEWEEQQTAKQVEEMATLVNGVLPPGWLPLGAMSLGRGNVLPALLGTLGLTLIGTASLWRAYRTTLRVYKGEYTAGKTRAAAAPAAKPARPTDLLVERKLPWISEQAAVIALTAFRSLLRAPEGKMLLLTPVLLVVIFGSMFFASGGGNTDPPQPLRPLMAFGVMVLVLFTLAQLIGNQFGFDRNGFRVYVLSPAPRRSILMGKNLALAPVALTMGAIAAVLVQVVYPMSLNHFLALAPRFVSMYLLYCVPANAMSILSPMRIAAGSFQPSRPGGLFIIWQFVFLSICPPILGLTLAPLGIDLLAEALDFRYGVPLDLILSLPMCVGVVYLYGLLLDLEGDWLEAREKRILEIVTTKEE
jgi:ABC-2 type transport system permease protein